MRDFLRLLGRVRAERDVSLARILGDVFRPDFTRPGAFIPLQAPVVRVERLGTRLSALVPTPEERGATERLLAATAELLDSGRNQ